MKWNPTLILAVLLAAPVLGQNAGNPLVGRWDFNMTSPRGTSAVWLGVTEKAGAFDVWYQPSGGNCYQVHDFKVDGSHLTITVSAATEYRPAMTWELDAAGDKITGVQKRGETTLALAGARAPELNRSVPSAWTAPESLFNGKNLDGWEPIGNPANSHWAVKDGLLVNEEHGANLKSVRMFDDFKLHFEVNCPDGGNSGFYLRGRYELQIEYEPLSENPPERRIGSIYGRIAPKVESPRTPGKSETFDVTLVGRTVTVVRNGVTIIDRQEIEGITGGALDANEGEPGPFYIQGDHTGGLSYRNITISVAKR
ncbi:MAG: DUF1080 domain-containing protein [Bryobacteraceae bacterium]|jgi:hypothetical protein